MKSDRMGVIERVSGPLVVADGMLGSKMYDVTTVGRAGLIGEIIQLRGERAIIQVYEDTTGIRPGEKVESTGSPLSVDLGPGLFGMIYDGIQRPLEVLRGKSGAFIGRGISADALPRNKRWKFVATAKQGSRVRAGDTIGYVQETELLKHHIMVPNGVSGTLTRISSGNFTITDRIGEINTGKDRIAVTMMQKRAVREAAPFARKFKSDEPMVTGMRVVDTLFPIAKGGTAAIPGPFGSGKTVTQHSIAKFADVDIVVYVGCGERGNEMTDVLTEFPELKDPRTGRPLMERTVLIANTSNMPVAAREASIYTGVTIAEYFRDMGYSVALLADSTSRWAEAMREISARLEEMPGEEGYPAYLPKRLAEYYERAGKIETMSNRVGSVTMIGAVSPPGGDISEPVSQGTLRVVKTFWALDAPLAASRHFPAINWLKSYSLYTTAMSGWYEKNVGAEYVANKKAALELLQKEAELKDIVQLVGEDALPDSERIVLIIGAMLREDFLRQSAFDEVDAYSSLRKQSHMLAVMMHYAGTARELVGKGVSADRIAAMKVRAEIARLKGVPDAQVEQTAKKLMDEINSESSALLVTEREGQEAA